MLSRRNQENLVHAHRTVPTGKPLSDAIKPLPPKTPGNGTAAITPGVPRTRAPLGVKTSNAKLTAFKTPAPLAVGAGLHKTQRRSASTRKTKLKIQPDLAPSEPILRADEEEEEDPDIEYCPPKITPLEYASDDELFPEGVEVPRITVEGLKAAWRQEDQEERNSEEARARYEAELERRNQATDALCDRVIFESIESTMHPDDLTPDFAAMKKAILDRDAVLNGLPDGRLSRPSPDPQKKPPQHVAAPAISARHAASALSGRPVPSFAAPTAAARARQVAALEPVKRNAPTVNSRSTIGYSRGKKVSSTLRSDGSRGGHSARPKQTQKNLQGHDFDSRGQEDLLRELTSRAEAEDDGSPLFAADDNFNDWFEQHLGGFRLTMPEVEEGEET